mmetsp:Transcript_118697/g.383271  ORF Transcript_118697/g.383271 Transcript_118697/m.383271 type:complete len:273 (+) Transcript_118697:1013-1831(+)
MALRGPTDVRRQSRSPGRAGRQATRCPPRPLVLEDLHPEAALVAQLLHDGLQLRAVARQARQASAGRPPETVGFCAQLASDALELHKVRRAPGQGPPVATRSAQWRALLPARLHGCMGRNRRGCCRQAGRGLAALRGARCRSVCCRCALRRRVRCGRFWRVGLGRIRHGHARCGHRRRLLCQGWHVGDGRVRHGRGCCWRLLRLPRQACSGRSCRGVPAGREAQRAAGLWEFGRTCAQPCAWILSLGRMERNLQLLQPALQRGPFLLGAPQL